MTSRPSLRRCHQWIARNVSSWRLRARSQRPSRQLAVHQKLLLLGTWLLISCVAVAAMGLWGLRVIDRERSQLTHSEVPALNQLLRTDIDLYEGQFGVERAATAEDASQVKA